MGAEREIAASREWEGHPQWPSLLVIVGQAAAATAGRHPGVVSEAIVAAVTAAYDLVPRERWHRERRRNHPERIRRTAHEVFRIVAGGPGGDPAPEIAGRILKAFILHPRGRGERA